MTRVDKIDAFPFQAGGEIVYSSQDAYGDIHVIEHGENRILSFDSLFEQSCMNIYHPCRLVHPYTQLMTLVLAFIEPKMVSILGLGGGSLLRSLHRVLPGCTFSVVELRAKVVDIANNHFLLPNDCRVKITVNDALEEISNFENNKIDIIFSDMFDAYTMVEEQTQKDFLMNCSRSLTSRGWLVINFHRLPQERSEFFELLNEFFPVVILSTYAENVVLMASKSSPESVCPDFQRIEDIDVALNQNLSQLASRLKPVNFKFQYDALS